MERENSGLLLLLNTTAERHIQETAAIPGLLTDKRTYPYSHYIQLYYTVRTTEGPRDAPRQMKHCQLLLHNSTGNRV